ncbi:MAG: hypothetical protein ABEL76_17255, partial [Bradymonadaceae bacterium]
LGVHWLGAHWHEFRAIRVSDGWRLRVPAVPTAFVWMAVLGPVIWYALTPWYWFDTWARVKWYLEFHLQHVNYFVQYFGENVQNPPLPISYPWVMTAVTVPAAILVAAAVGGGRAWREWDGRAWVGRWSQAVRDLRLPRSLGARPATGWLLVLNLLFPIVLISLPSVPIFGGTKHWMTAMPFLAIFAGGGVGCAAGTVAEAIDERVGSVPRPAGLALAGGLCLTTVLGPSAYATAHIHPFETGYYNSLIGSVRGAADAGMLRQFWGYASRQGLPWLNEHAPKGAQVWTGNTTGYAWWFYQDAGWARGDLRRGSRAGSDFGLFHHQKSFAADRVELWSEYGTYTPEHVVSVEGVPMLSIYARPGTDESSGSP